MARKPTEFINCLTEKSQSAVALGVLVKNAQGEERCLDLLVENDSFSTVTAAIRAHVPGIWFFEESWEIEPPVGIGAIAA